MRVINKLKLNVALAEDDAKQQRELAQKRAREYDDLASKATK